MLKYILFIFIFFTTHLSYSQLADFNLNVIPTDETCSGNGSLDIQVTGTTAGSELIYKLYLAPDYVNAIAETTSNIFGSLPSGSYKVIATQTLAGLSNTQQQEVVIQDLVIELDFELSHSVITNCDVTGTITVNVLSGNATFFEIISGPIIVPQQTSNIFTGLTSGTYIVRVYDNCQDALSKTYTMFLTTNNLEISPSILPPIYDSCTTAIVTTNVNSISGVNIVYPLTITYTVFPPDGSLPVIIVENLVTGQPQNFGVTQTIPLFGNLPFTMSVTISDVCGNVFQNETVINPNPITQFIPNEALCGLFYFSIGIKGFMPPYNINFTTAPAGFVPSISNINYPGPFSEIIVDFGDEENPIPFGNYIATVQDACGRTSVVEYLLEETPLEPIVTAANNGCASLFGLLRIQIPEDRLIVSVTIISAPVTYVATLPSDVSVFINAMGIFLMQNLPIGDYILTVTDDCGKDYIIEINVPEFIEQDLFVIAKPNCDPASGSVRISSSNGALPSMVITAAPLTYMQVLPYDVSFNINTSGVFFMNDLPAGNYTFQAIDACGFIVETSVEITGYISTPNGYNVNRNCGSFDIGILDSDTTVTGQTYWFQKFFPQTNTWGHPYNGFAYVEGEVPNTTNSIELTNSNTLLNIYLTGDFRVIKVFQSFNNGGSNNDCLDIYATFNISSNLIISGVYSLDCEGGSGIFDVVLDVIGVAPYNFTIVSPFVFDNGENNVFSGLSPGIYNFKVEDDCGNIENIEAEVGNLLPLARANEPKSMLICRNDGVEVGVFMLTTQNTQILGNQNSNDYDVTYHLSQADANTGDNPLPEAYTNVFNPQTIYVRVAHKKIALCYATTSFSIFIGTNPILSPEELFFICQGSTRVLTADAGFAGYEWSTGATTQSIVVSEPGIYNVIVKNVYEDFSCDSTKNFTVNGSGIATFQHIEINDWSASSNSITVWVSGIGDYEYSLDNQFFQDENIFNDLIPGNYTVYIRDKKGCGTIMDEIVLLNYPAFFTPNGDGYNDTWHIKFASMEPELEINIFDRYGKFLLQLNGNGPGWDGSYNGKSLPSSDYWFVVNRFDGKTYKGHFSLKR